MKTFLALAFLLQFSPFEEPQVVQYSTIDAFLAGTYEGTLTVGELKQKGNFGIGTFNQIDGELIMLDGEVYQIPAKGEAHVAALEAKIPYATLCTFKPSQLATIHGPADLETVRATIEQHMFTSGQNIFYAVKLEGTFKQVVARSPQKMSDPNAAISKLVDDQSVFTFKDVEGTMLGFWAPQYLNGITVSGWHMHFITKDKTRGGHVLDFDIGEIDVSIMELMGFDLILPRMSTFYNAELDLDRAEIQTKIEKSMSTTPKHLRPGIPPANDPQQ